MNKRAIWAIARKDIRAITANIQVWLPMAIIPVVMGVFIPALFIGILVYAGFDSSGDLKELAVWLDKLPPSALKEFLDTMASMEQRIAYVVANYMLAPLFLLIPLMTASVISADSFAGEKERGTLETLLFAPVDLFSLFAGKVLAALIPAVSLSVITLVLCSVVLNALGWPLFGALFFPAVNWLPLMLLVIPLISLLTILITVFVSARVATFQAAYQSGGMLVLPFIALLVGQFAGLLLLDATFMLIAAAVLAVIDFLLLRMMLRWLDRNLLFQSQVR